MMKLVLKLTLIVFCFFICSCSSKNAIEIKEGTIEEGMVDAQKQGKKLVAIISKQGCSPCDLLQRNIVVNNQLNDFLFYKIDCETPENGWLNQWLYHYAFPTNVILSSEGELITIVSSGNIKSLIEVLNGIQQNKTASIYKYSETHLKLKNKELVNFLNNLLKARNNRIKNKLNIKDSLLYTINQESYFYNNYLISKYFKSTGDTAQAKTYAQKALTYKEELDAILYSQLRTELNYINDNNYNLSDQPYMAINETELDLGEIKVNQINQAKFLITNKGKKPLIIQKVGATCACTSVNWDKKPILPGTISVITANFKAEKAGVFQKSIRVFSNAYNAPLLLSFKARVF